MTVAADILAPSLEAPPYRAGGLADTDDLGGVYGRAALRHAVCRAAEFAGGDSWLDLLAHRMPSVLGDELLVVVTYCYLRAIYRSCDVAVALETDPELAGLRDRMAPGPEQVRQFRREHRRALTDCLTRALVLLANEGDAGDSPEFPRRTRGVADARRNLSFLEPYYLAARRRIEQAVLLDSMAMDE